MLFPLVELNYFWALNDGERDDLVPSIVHEGGDVINSGSSNADNDPDFVTLTAGLRYKVIPPMELGFTYESPLTKKEDGLVSSRFSLDMVWRF
ncbi:MAG TPA: hypothetical protein PLG17_06135 [Thermodesulfobacteriota bacterium]|nr:hypothetical protein [Thermodesulfobacteriota bacterium]HNU70738.1 hypothetical protein [Thermodesulfobacteriota bacterium]HQO78076.1 hypothetical protein [Thermodesulfobacteriota bacterium]